MHAILFPDKCVIGSCSLHVYTVPSQSIRLKWTEVMAISKLLYYDQIACELASFPGFPASFGGYAKRVAAQ